MRLSCCVHKIYAEFESEPIARLRSNDVNRWAATALPRSVWRGRALRLSSLICSTNESPPRRDAEGLLDGESDGDTNILGVGRFDEKKKRASMDAISDIAADSSNRSTSKVSIAMPVSVEKADSPAMLIPWEASVFVMAERLPRRSTNTHESTTPGRS